jgi:uncharacterized membrane protein (DUF373 family)
MLIIFRKIKQSFPKLLALTFAMLIVATLFGVFQSKLSHHVISLSHIVSQNTQIFTCIRLGFIGALTLVWPFIIRLISRKKKWSKEKTNYWLGKRFYVAGWLIVFELLICENILMSLIKVL